ncbi:MAG TPA: hypothetical protein VMR98_05405, partial [Candidatus Polarisedimenticolaceae bacterium]|nr:hypothetical protein [Candidatus Polarisedimenticolaceae bacterium]
MMVFLLSKFYMENKGMADKPKKIDPVEVFAVIGASDQTTPDALKEASEEIGASPEVVEFMEQLPSSVHEPSDVVAAATNP